MELKKASTVILVRENNKEIEVYLLKRNTKSRFMGGLYVFPGGVVEPDDIDINAWATCIDIPKDKIKKQIGGNALSDKEALGFSIAAIRETLEEAGVFIASTLGRTQKDIEDICNLVFNFR